MDDAQGMQGNHIVAGLLLEFPRGTGIRLLAGFLASGDDFQDIPLEWLSILANKDKPAVRNAGHDSDRAGMADDLPVGPVAGFQFDHLRLNRDHPPGEHGGY